MNCPYCSEQMKTGWIRCDNRAGVMWIGEDDKTGWFARAINRTGQLSATKIGVTFAKTPASFCSACKKIIIDTDILG